MKKAGAALIVVIIFLVPMLSGPPPVDRFSLFSDAIERADDYLPSDWQDSNSGNGDPLLGNFNGFKVASGTSSLDFSKSGFIGIDPPLGWNSQQLEGQLDHLSIWADGVLVNPNLDSYHEEHWFMTGNPEYNNDPFFTPDGWTIVKFDASGGTEHPQHGVFEINSYSGNGYDNSQGWRFDANPSSGTTLDPSNQMYLSQQISIPWRSIYSAEIKFRYYVSSTSILDNDVFIFTRVEDYISKNNVFVSGTPMDTWLQATNIVPASAFQSMEDLGSMIFDIGLGTDITGIPGASVHEVYIDEVDVRLQVRPFTEQIDLRANGAKVTGSTQGSVSPYVPDGSNRDCYSAPDSNGGSGGVDLNGYGDNGWLDVGADIPAYPDWTTAFSYQAGLQFPLHVPQGSAVTSATLQVEAPSDSTGLPGMRIYVAAEDDVAAFTSGYPLLPDRYNWVNTSIYWRPSTWIANGRYDTPDIAALIQEVVSRPGWQSGNYICVMIDYAYSNQQYAYNQIKGSAGFAQADLARLFVEYTEVDPSDIIPSFQFNKDIVFDHTRVVADLQDFPVLVDIWDEDLHFNTQPDGDDIAFLYNGQVIPHELELFDKKGNGTHAHLVCWVKVPQLSSVEDTTIVMVYGDEDLGSQEDPESVWDSDYSSVLHLDNNPAQPQWDSTYADYLPHQPQILDSTWNNLDGLSYGTMTSSDSVSGQIGNAIDLDGINDFVDFGNPSELQMSGAFTVEAWFNADFIDNDYLVVKSGESNYRGWDLSFDDDPTISPAGWVMFRFSPDGVAMTAVGYERVDTGHWYHVVGVFSPSSYVRFYLNGELAGELTSGVPASVNDPPNRPVRIGRRSDNPGGTSYMDTIVDEVRISTVARSDAWIRTQYNNQKSPHLFLSVGDESANFQYMKDITIDHTRVDSDLEGFPVLIDIFDSDLRTKVQTDGDDIAFLQNGRSIPHEIELFNQQYNSTHAHLIAWVKADLSSAVDTVLTMYYGNPLIGNQENPEGVWGINYFGVWHLGETSGDALDSTYLGIDGTVIGGPTRGVSGAVGNAYAFDGSDDYISLANSYTEVTGTYSFWVYPVGFPPGPNSEVNFMGADAYLNRISYYNSRIRVETATDAEYFDFTSSSIVADDWLYVVFVRSGDFGDLYINGVWIQQDEVVGANTLTVNSIAGTVDLDRMVNGTMDEVRISTAALSAGWIITEYNNQQNPFTFYSLGIEQEVVTPKEVPLDFTYRKDITIDHTKVTSDLYGFPVLIDLYDADLRFNVQPDGDDIVFAMDGWILPHEIELFEQSYNSSHAHLIVWVRADLSASSDTVISMYYGNPTTESYENPHSVWDTSFGAVWHLSEDPSGTVYDSTANGNDGVGLPIGSEPTLQTGKIYGSSEFYGEATNDRIESPHSSSLVLQTDMLVEAWIQTSNTDPTSDVIVAKWGDVGHRNYWLGKLDGSTLAFYVDNTQSVTAPLSWISDGNWHHIVGVADSLGGDLLLYIDGIERGNALYSGSTQTGTSVIQIGNNPGSTGFIQEWDGRIDEVRVSNSYRSLDWIVTEFNNQNDPDSFYSIAGEILSVGNYEFSRQVIVSAGSEPIPAGYSTSITIDHGALVLAGKSQADGDDLRILYWNGLGLIELDRVLDSDSFWSSSTTKLWFKIQSDIPALTSDNNYYLYYGNPSALSPPDNHANVFQFYDGFESGDVSAWDGSYTDTGDSLTVTTEQANTGSYSAKGEVDNQAAAQAMVWKDFSDKTNLLARVHFYISPTFSTTDHVTIMQFVDTSSGWVNQLSLTIRDDMTLYLWNAIAGEAYGYGTTSAISTGSWHMIELQAKFSTTTGEARMWFDGNLEVEETGKNLGAEGVDKFCTVFYWASPQTEPNIVFADDVMLRPYVNPEPTTSFGAEVDQTVQLGYKKDITIDHTKVTADLDDFPLLIDIFDTDLKTKVQPDGDDIIFKSGGVILPHEIEIFEQSYNASHAHLVAWVKADLLSSTDTVITMYYGNPNIDSQENAPDVWNSNFKGVWHLSEDPTGTIYDSSGNLNHGTGYNLQSDDQVSGQIDGSIDFDNVQDHIDCGNDSSLNVGSVDFSLSLWFKYDGVDMGVLAGKGAVLMANRYRLSIESGPGMLMAEIDDNTVAKTIFSTSTYGDNLWHHVSMVRDGNNLRLYIDGVEDPNSPIDITGYGSLDESESFYINAFRSEVGGTIGYWSTANTDEVRVAKLALSPEWIATEYSNQENPASFYTVGPEIIPETEYAQTLEFKYKKELVVDHTKVSEDLVDFPMLIDIFDKDLRTNVQSDADDIMFKTGYVWCPHEIVFFDKTYNETHAHLIAWIKTDLSSTIDTTITMYYGNPELTSQENPSLVWGNYVGAWHLDESPTGLVYDSSPFNNDGVTLGSMSGSDLIPGQIGNGFKLDGIDDMINVSESPSLDSIKYAGTLSLWINWVDSSNGGYQRIMTTSDRFILNPTPPPTILQDDGFEFAVQPDGDNYFYPWGGNSIDYNLATNPFTNSIWHHLAVTLDYSSKSVVIYLDGTPLSFAIENVPTEWTQLASLGDWLWGANQLDAASHFQGRFDEIRVTTAVRSEGWMITEYNNQYDPESFYSVGVAEQISGSGYIFTTNSDTSVTIGAELSLGVQTTTLSYADDFSLGSSFSIVNGSLPIWSANVLVSPPPEIDALSFEISYPEGEWWPFSVKTPSGVEKSFTTDWTCFDGKLIVESTAIDEYGMWKIQFLDRNHVLDMQMGPSGGPYSSSDKFAVGDNIQFRTYSSGITGSTISLELTDPTGSTWYTGTTTFQGERFTLPYYHRKHLTISQTKVAEDLVNFPVLVDIYDADLRTSARPDGRDIAFTIGEETLSHEIELFDQTFNLTHAHLIAWVKVPLLSGSSDTVISMYYDNPLAPIVYASGSVWDSDYVGVWHLGESGSGVVDEYTDSSIYKNNGQGGNGNVGYVPSRVATQIGYGQNFTDHFIDCGNATSLDITNNQITLQLWMQYPSATHPNMGPFNHKGWYSGYRFTMSQNSQNMRINLGPRPTGGTYDLGTSQNIAPNAWHHVVATYDGSLVKFYIDGSQDAATMEMTTNILSALPDSFRIGHADQPEGKAWTFPWLGQIDEVRISNIARSGEWIQTEFENQNNPSGFYSVGAEEDIGYSESASINLDTSAPAGVWHSTARYSDSSSDVNYRAGLFTRSFIVKRGTSLSLTAPGDAVGDGITTKLVGEQLYVEFELEDALDATLVSGATISMNWSVSGVPTDVQLNDYGDGRYGKTLNTTDLDTYGRWRIDIESSHPFYNNATDFFYLDLSHRTFLTYAPPLDVPYGDNLEIRLTLKDNFDNTPLTGAIISCNGTIVGLPTDYGNGTYLVTIDSTGLSTGEHVFRFTATPDTSYLLSSSIDVQFTYRPIATEVTPLTPDTVDAPWGQQANTSVYCYDVDHAEIGVDGGLFSIEPATQILTYDDGGGYYSLTIDVSSLAPGIYYFNLTFSKLNYQSSMSTISITILPHSTTLSVDHNSSIPVGTDVYFDIYWLDLNLDSVVIGNGNLSQVSLDWGTGSDSFFAFGFWLDTSGWAVGSYSINVTVSAIGAPRFYIDSYIVIQLEIRKLNVYLSWDPLEPFPNGNDFVMFVYVNISEPGNPIDGTPITGLDQSYFSATNETGDPYTFKSFSNLGGGVYQITIDYTRFLEGQYKIIVFVDFLPSENYIDRNTPEVLFTYRPILTYLSSPDYPTVTTSFDTNVTVALSYVDIDHVQNITIGTITSEGASIIWQHLGDGVYEVLIIVQGWDLGAHEVNLTADANGYQAKTLTFQILVQIAYAYARSSVSLIDLPVGDTTVFYADYWDITHDEPIIGANINHNWTYALSITWTGDQYRIELPSMNDDLLGSYLIMFNFSKGSNYQFGYFNLSIILRTHLTEFRLAGAVEPTSYNAMVNISIYCGDLDNDAGVIESPVSFSVYGDSGLIPATYVNDTVLGNGYYILSFAAINLGPSGIFELTVYFNWTGPVQKYYDGALVASVKIIGEASDLSLIDSAEPTPYLDNLTYIYLYSELYSGIGISNISAPAGNVFVYVDFVGLSVSPSQYTIREEIGNPGCYSVVFNSTIFGRPGVYTMIVYVNWSRGVDPGYGNWTDTVAVRIIPRSTVVNLIPPESTPFGVNATFSFSFDDVAEASPYRIANGSQMRVSIGLPDYSIIYNESTRMFHVSFNTSVLGAPLGSRQFTIGVTWNGEPYYANVTSRTVIVSVRFRETEFDYSTISPTPYGDNVTLLLTFTDVTSGSNQPIDDGVVTLFNGTQVIPVSEYSFSPIGNGEYEIEFKTTYFAKPGTYSIKVEMNTGHFYYASVTATRSLSLRYRLTVLLIEPVAETPFNNSLEVIFHYSDVLTLADIGNGSTLTSIRILNGSSWIFNSMWRSVSEDYLLTVQTYNQNLEIDKEYVLWIEVSYPDSSPFYLSSETFVSFTLRERPTSLELTTTPEPTQYLENVNFSIYYEDSLSFGGIAGATITLTISGIDLVEGVDYVLESPDEGSYYISLNTTALGAAGATVSLVVQSSWNATAPFYSTSTLILSLSVTQRNSIAEILSSIPQVKFLENITFTIQYSDVTTGSAIQLNKNQMLIYSEGDLLQINDFSMVDLGTSYKISINSSVLNTGLVSNWNITFYIDWQSNVAPYYADGRASARVSVVNRVGIVKSDTTPTVPIHDNMTLEFTYTDDSTHAGINGAIVEFDCLSPSGLIEGVDFWILRNAGNYSILVDTDSLGSTGTFTFSLRLLWNPTLVPFYRNTTTIFLQGSVRLIQAQLTNEEPDPSTVPIDDNVSVVLNFRDLDHVSPIVGAEDSFSVVYKTNASGPTTWSITPISPGVYELIVDCHDAGATGTNALIITLTFSDYQTVEIQVPFQIRLRQGELNELPPPSTYFGETTYVIVELVDVDGGNAPIDGATLTITWPDIGYTPDYTSIGLGLYNITLTTASLDAGLYTLVVGAQVSDYFISDISVPIQIRSIPTELILPQTISDVYWGQDISFWAILNNTRDDVLISGALVVYQLGVLGGDLTEVIIDPGNYSVTLDTGNLAVASTYVVSITATLKNYVTVTGQLTVNILKLPISLTVVSEAQPDVFKGSGVNITVYVNNTNRNTPLLGATVEVTWLAQGPKSIILSPVPGLDGYYTGFVNTDDLFVGEYVLTITADRTNYVTATTSVSVRIRQISTVVFLDALTSTYGTQTFNWSDTIRIGVYVLAPSLNESDPLSTGLANCTVVWSLSGTGYTGEFLNGSLLDRPGYFYFDFETWDYKASTYTLRITAKPNIGMYAYSSNLTTLIIEPIETSVESTYLSPKIWGWTGWINLTYWDLLFDRGIAGANVLVDWNGSESVFRELANGTYQIFINASLVYPGIYPISVIFSIDNYKSGTGVFTLNVKEVPTAIAAYAPEVNLIDDDVLNLQVPYGDVLPLVLFYNDTWYNRGILGATEMTGVILGGSTLGTDYLLIEEIADGNYSLLLDTTRWTVSPNPYRLILSFYLANWSRATIEIHVTIINVPTGLQVEGSTSIILNYGQEYSIWVFYFDTWESHTGEGIAGASMNATSLDPRFVIVSLNQSDPSRPGWYEIRVWSQRTQGSAIVSIIISKENYDPKSEFITISVEPSDFDILIERAIVFGVPIGLVIIAGAVLWTRLFSVPKRLREIRGMVRTISKGKIPEPPDNVPSRQEIVADLFNDIAEPLGITKTASSMPDVAVATDVPEIEELLIQLSILSKLTVEEFEDFKLDVSKMKLSEQVAFVKEVINQEAIKQGRIDGKPMEEILEESAAKARASLTGEEIDQGFDREPVEEKYEPIEMEELEKPPPEPVEFEEVDTTDILDESELKEMRRRLVDAGIDGSELATIMDQARELPRELAEELLKSILGKGGEDE
ncbi:MAG: DUF2341 domain-containing protein [Candidatus Thorarchaeota archaeon]